MPFRIFSILLFCSLFISCQEQKTVEIAVYNWDNGISRYSLPTFRNKNHFSHLYVRLFDVKWHSDYGAYPVAHVQSDLSYDSSLEIIPVVYITNEALLLTPMDSIAQLTQRIHNEINFHWQNTFGNSKYVSKELQFDCDWTARTKEKYFELLKGMKEFRKESLSCTVKMYQYAYRDKAGIPPVDKAVLMCYNLQDLSDLNIRNSIFDAEEAKKYLKKADYPLPLDFALPEFDWALVFRNGKFKGIDPGIFKTDMDELHVKPLDSIRYVFLSDYESYWHEVDFLKGDIVKFEKAGNSDYLKIKEELKHHFNQEHTRIILFDLSHLEFSEHAEDSTYFNYLEREFSF